MRETGYEPNSVEMEGVGIHGNIPESEIESAPEPKKSRRFLAWLGKHARTLIAAELGIGGIVIGEVWKPMVGDFVFDKKYQSQMDQLQRLEDKEKKLQELFGESFSLLKEAYRERLRAEYKEHRKSYRKIICKPEKIVGSSFGAPEGEDTPIPLFTHIDTKQGRLDSDTVRQIFLDTLPLGWVKNEVSSVRQVDIEAHEDGVVRLKNEKGNPISFLAVCRGGRGSEKSQIIFYKPAKHHSPSYIIGTTIHEDAHANSWTNDAEMTTEERADMALDVVARLQSANRFKSSYVESITDKDPQMQLRARANEYWAEIAAQYFEDPTKLHIKDFQLVDNHIRKTDRQFNWQDAKQRRDQLVAQALKTQKYAARR